MSVTSEPAGASLAGEAKAHFLGSRREYWRLLSRDALALIGTLGVYRFWVSTDIRKYLWSRTELAGEPLDYTGNPLDLVVGFLVLFVALAPLALIVAVLGIASGRNGLAYLPLLALIPIGLLAAYQARRYRVNNTVYRGLRFYQSGSAWFYALLTLLWSAACVVTLGLCYPWARTSLERYKMRHTYFGDVAGRFEGSALTLFQDGWRLWAVMCLAALFTLVAGPPGLLIAAVPTIMIYPIFRAKVLRWRLNGIRFGTLMLESHLSDRCLYRGYLQFLACLVALALIVVVLALAQLVIAPLLPFGRSVVFEFIWVIALVIGYFAAATFIAFAYMSTVRLETWRRIVETLELHGTDQLERATGPVRPAGRFSGRVAASLNFGGF